MNSIFDQFERALVAQDGTAVAKTLSPHSPTSDPHRNGQIYASLSSNSAERNIHSRLDDIAYRTKSLTRKEVQGWEEVYFTFWRAIGEINAAEAAIGNGLTTNVDWVSIYTTWKELTNAAIKGFTHHEFPGYATSCLFVVGEHLRRYAIMVDQALGPSRATVEKNYGEDLFDETSNNQSLEEAARIINRIFQLCHNDRAPLEESRKRGIYYVASLLFKTYFKLQSISLCKNIMRAISASADDMQELLEYPTSHVVAYSFYVGVIHFLDEDYAKSEAYLQQAWKLCHRRARRNMVLILTYLIPCRLVTSSKLPTKRMLNSYGELRTLFGPLCASIKAGSLAGFDREMETAGQTFVKRRIFLTLERSRMLVYRNLFRNVCRIRASLLSRTAGSNEASGVPASRKVPIASFSAGIKLSEGSKAELEREEVESLTANLISNGLMKGYISREHAVVVLSKDNAFPGTAG